MKEENIKSIMNTLFDVLENESKEKYDKLADKIYEKLKDYNINNPENYNLFLDYKLNRILKLVVDKCHKSSTQKYNDKPNFIYMKYDFLSNNIRRLIEQKEGFGCCADKTRSILEMYLNYLLTGEIPNFTGEEIWYEPKFGTYIEWINFCDGLYEVYYGYTENYFKALKTLITSEVRKYKHTIYTLHAKFINGNIIDIYKSTSIDNKDELIKCYLENGYYKFTDIQLKGVDKSKYKCKNGIINQYLVPKDEIEEFYVDSKEIML